MKVLFLPKWYPDAKDLQFGVFIQKHAKAVSLCAEVFVLYISTDPSPKIEFSQEKGFPEVRVYYKESKSKNPLSKLRQLIRFYRATLKGYRLISKKFGKPDLFHVNILARTGLFPLLLKKIFGKPYIVTEQWSGYSYGDFQKKGTFNRFVCKLIGNNAFGIIAVSNALVKKMKECGFKNDFFVVPNIVEKINLPEASITNDELVKIFNISDMDDSKKNITGIIEAFSIICDEYEKVELHIVGGGKDFEQISNLIKLKHNLAGKVILYGRRDNNFVYELMPKMDFLVTNSYFETFSVATVEALINGKPVIVSKCGGPEDFITSEVGILYEVDDLDALVAAMKKMISSYKNFNPQKLSDYANSRFSYEAVGENICKIYKTIPLNS